MAAPAPQPGPIRRDGFHFDGSTFTTDSTEGGGPRFQFAHPEELLRLVYPNEPPERWRVKKGRGRPRKLEPISEAEAERALSRDFVLAQCRFYGVALPPHAGLVDAFKAEVAAGNFMRMAPHVAELQAQMKREWDAMTGGPIKRPRGRPKGSTKKDSGDGTHHATTSSAAGTPTSKSTPSAKGPRGRPKGSTKKPDAGVGVAALKKRPSGPAASIVGSYAIRSPEIEQEYPQPAHEMTLDVSATSTPGVYTAFFNFRVLEGVMFLSADEAKLARHVDKLERGGRGADGFYAGGGDDEDNGEEEDSDGDDDDEEEEDANGTAAHAGQKRKAAGNGTTPSAKKAKTEVAETSTAPTTPSPSSGLPLKFFLQWRGRETGEGTIQVGEHSGSITFENRRYARFAGYMDMSFVAANGEFRGTKMSDVPNVSGETWADFSENAYEWERLNRWR